MLGEWRITGTLSCLLCNRLTHCKIEQAHTRMKTDCLLYDKCSEKKQTNFQMPPPKKHQAIPKSTKIILLLPQQQLIVLICPGLQFLFPYVCERENVCIHVLSLPGSPVCAGHGNQTQ